MTGRRRSASGQDGAFRATGPARAATTELPHPGRLRHAARDDRFAVEDLSGGGSDRLIDELFAWGKPDEIAARLTEHHRAGADHIAVQVVTDSFDTFARQAWRDLAPELLAA
ncbi:hypothetical protein [Streptomyces anulatus]|uniref:hypothetical protein n=1 Tax=Streptomyces anulatus TaxID=1892 RepID=UPI00255C9BDC|nr:hypothetical protein [Streptomyces anulatus]WIY78940.1 hypothetical protein QPM16_27055 [Streptomyces anulatus]